MLFIFTNKTRQVTRYIISNVLKFFFLNWFWICQIRKKYNKTKRKMFVSFLSYKQCVHFFYNIDTDEQILTVLNKIAYTKLSKFLLMKSVAWLLLWHHMCSIVMVFVLYKAYILYGKSMPSNFTIVWSFFFKCLSAFLQLPTNQVLFQFVI